LSKLLIFSDLHLHKHKDRIDRLQDCIDVLDWVFDQAIENNCKNIAFLGDLFHERAKIDVLNYLRCFEVIFKRMTGDCKDMNLYMLVGNHDMYHRERWDINSIKPLSAIPAVRIIENPTTIDIDGIQIDWLPHTENPVVELEKLKSSTKSSDILFAHVAVHGAMLNTFFGTRSDIIVEHDNEMIPVDIHCFNNWKMVVLGHYHGAQKLSEKIEYIGSPLQLGFGEAFQNKHIMVLELETLKKSYITNNFSPKHLIVSPDDIKNDSYDLNGQFVRLSVDDIGQVDLIDLQKKITQEYTPLSVDTKEKDKKKNQDCHIVKEARKVLNDTRAMLTQYVEDAGVPEGLNKDLLLKIGFECLTAI
jgi:DNA repair exonuclease SbcCD nuclease subunit